RAGGLGGEGVPDRAGEDAAGGRAAGRDGVVAGGERGDAEGQVALDDRLGPVADVVGRDGGGDEADVERRPVGDHHQRVAGLVVLREGADEDVVLDAGGQADAAVVELA